MSVASVCLARGKFAAAGTATLFTCPAGQTAIVKSIYLTSFAAAAVNVAVWITPLEGASSTYLVAAPIDPNKLLNWTGWVVLQPGDHLLMNASASGVQLWVSGALLDGVDPLVRPPITPVAGLKPDLGE